jgi:hypothetical protein
VPESALAAFGALGATLAALDAGFDAMSANEEFAEHAADIDAPEADEEEEAEVIELKLVGVVPEFDDEAPDDELDTTGFVVTEEILAKMFANMVSHGLKVG